MPNLEKLDTKTLIHVASETAAAGLITFWLNKKITSNEVQIQELTKKINEFQEIIEKQDQVIMNHENLLSQMLGGPATHRRPVQPNQPEMQRTSKVPSSREETFQPEIPDSISVSTSVTPEELDSILSDEITDLEGDRKKCDEESCSAQNPDRREDQVQSQNPERHRGSVLRKKKKTKTKNA
ncbi:hypothetical protein OAG24_01005 [bacterium]|nr:hypothetical protein [bacterium]